MYVKILTKKIGSMKAHQDDVTGLYLLPDETSIVSVSKDKSMKVNFICNKFSFGAHQQAG